MRNLSVGHNKDMSHPGGKLLHRSQGISQLIIVFKSTARDILISAKLQVFIRHCYECKLHCAKYRYLKVDVHLHLTGNILLQK